MIPRPSSFKELVFRRLVKHHPAPTGGWNFVCEECGQEYPCDVVLAMDIIERYEPGLAYLLKVTRKRGLTQEDIETLQELLQENYGA